MSDLISRQGIIDKIEWYDEEEHMHPGYIKTEHALEMINNMPPAEPEIIRCKDCNNSEHWYADRRRCFLWVEDGISVFDNGFCNYAKRRTDG